MIDVSLVIINEDAEEYLGGLLSSIRDQISSERLILVDNCSEDNSIKKARELGISRVYQFGHKIENRASLLNKGYELSESEYVIFAHSDVYFAPDFFEKLFSRLSSQDKSSADFINFSQYYADGNVFGSNQLGFDFSYKDIYYRQIFQNMPEGVITFLECSEGCFMVRRKALEFLRFNQSYYNSFYEYDLLNKLIVNGCKKEDFSECKFTHYFIEFHEKEITLEKDQKIFLGLNQEIFSLRNKDLQLQEMSRKEVESLHMLNSLHNELGKKDEVINSHVQMITELTSCNERLDKEVLEKNQIIEKRNDKIDHLTGMVVNLEREVNEKENLINGQTAEIDKLVDINGRLQKQILKLRDEFQKDEIVKNLNGHIEQLLERERELEIILNSRGWKLLKLLYSIEDKIIPIDSKRRLFSKIIYRIAKNPTKILKNINLYKIKQFIRYLKNEDNEILTRKWQQFLDIYAPKETKIKITKPMCTDKKLIFRKVNNPLVTIIIPVYNQWNYTYSCLNAILENTQGISYEIIIADDVSIDETTNIGEYVDNVKTIRNTENLGFLLNCNKAAKQAKGKYILFLNNDTNVQKDWLKHLVKLIETDDSIGMVGSKLVYLDGRLQEAGGIIWKDASGWNYGRLDDPGKPEYNYVKEVDYISGASIMIKKDLWERIGGFDERYAPAYFEDADLAFEIRKLGYKVVYQPKSVVIHFEGVSHGKDINEGIKNYQVKNREKFIEKWRHVLEEQFHNGQNVFWARDRSTKKRTILVIDHYVPQYDKDAGSRTTFQYLKLFVDMGLNVKFIGDNFYKHEPYTCQLEQLGIEVLYGSWYRENYKKWIIEHSSKIDYIYLNRPHISIKYIDAVRKHTKAKIIYYGHDLHYLRELREYKISGSKEILKSSDNWKEIEYELFKKSDVVYYPSQIEINEIKKHFPDITARSIPAYIFDRCKKTQVRSFDERKDLLFVGGFSHKPNIDGVMWFIKETFPLIKKEIPGIKFIVVGSNPPTEVLHLHSDSIDIKGFVTDEELNYLYSKCRVIVVPLRYGAGVKGKVVEAMYNNAPIVTTSIGAEGLPSVDDVVLIADAPEDFSEAVTKLYNDVKRLNDISRKAKSYVERLFSRESAMQIITNDIHNIKG